MCAGFGSQFQSVLAGRAAEVLEWKLTEAPYIVIDAWGQKWGQPETCGACSR